jgi:hypothetical protein
MGMMGSRPLDVSYRKLTEWIPSGVSKTEAGEVLSKISGMLPIYRSLEQKQSDLILWQFTAFENGIYTVYPAIKRMPMMRGGLKSDWYELAKKRNQVVWSKPDIDPFTTQIVFTVSAPFYQPNGDLMGVTAIAVPVDVLLQKDDHYGILCTHKDKTPNNRHQYHAVFCYHSCDRSGIYTFKIGYRKYVQACLCRSPRGLR